jgi:uncharacterized RDD family membrane protein YckC
MKIISRYLLALLYDSFIMLTFFLASTALLLLVLPPSFPKSHPWIYWSILLGFYFGFIDYCWRHTGQTIGAKCWKLVVVSNTGDHLSLTQRITRYIFSIPCVISGANVVTMLVLPKYQTIPGLLSGTRIELR